MNRESTRLLLALGTMGLIAAGCAPRHSSGSSGGQKESVVPNEASQDDTTMLAWCPEPEDTKGLSFTLTGNRWPNVNVSASFMPDGTADGGLSSGLFGQLDLVAPRATWQREFARALARWAAVTPLNIRFVTDQGQVGGAPGPIQAANQFGDIRVGSIDLGTSYAGMTVFPILTSTSGGDTNFNSQKTYQIGQGLDIFTIALHEFGHSIGLNHSTFGNVMFGGIYKVYSQLEQDDINGAQAIYGPRLPDAYDSSANNDTPATASIVTIAPSGPTFINGDLTTTADLDHYRFTVPAGAPAVLSVTAIGGQSLLQSTLRLHDALGNILAEVSAPGYGQTALLQFNGVNAGDQFIIGVDSPVEDEFGSGAYRLAVEFRATQDGLPYSMPTAAAPDGRETNDGLAFATSLGQTSNLTVSGLSTHWTWDEDFYSFRTAKGSVNNYDVSIAYTSGTAPLEIELFDAAGTKIAQSKGATTVRAAVKADTSYTAHIYSPTRLQRGYNLTIKKFN